MLPKNSRLNLKKDFIEVSRGKLVETFYLKLYLRVGENTKPRLGIATSQKTFKKAHERNRARRLTSHAFEAIYGKLPPKLNIIALPKRKICEVKSKDVLGDLEGVLRNEKIID